MVEAWKDYSRDISNPLKLNELKNPLIVGVTYCQGVFFVRSFFGIIDRPLYCVRKC